MYSPLSLRAYWIRTAFNPLKIKMRVERAVTGLREIVTRAGIFDCARLPADSIEIKAGQDSYPLQNPLHARKIAFNQPRAGQ
jgi:hypothetical protein